MEMMDGRTAGVVIVGTGIKLEGARPTADWQEENQSA
jgi:hypothetical protein